MAAQTLGIRWAARAPARILMTLLLLAGLAALMTTWNLSQAQGASFTAGETAVVDTPRLNCRTGPGLDYEVDHVMNGGETVTVLDGPVSADGYHWYRLEIDDGTEGWAIGEGLTTAGAFSGDERGDGTSIPAGTHVYVNTDTLNLRSDAGLSTGVITQLSTGAQLTVSSGPVIVDGYDWYAVETEAGEYGWVAGIYLGYASNGAGEDDGWSGGFDIGDIAVIDAPSLNCRTGPGFAYTVDHVMAGGEQVIVLEGPIPADGYHWFQLAMEDGDIAWAIGEGLAPTGDSDGSGDGDGTWFPKGAEVIVNTDRLNLRVGAGLTQGVIMTLPYGTPLIVSNGPMAADGYNWYEVETLDGDLGWVAGAFLAYGGDGQDGSWVPYFAIGSTATIDAPRLNCRTGPGLDYAVDHVMNGGEVVTVLDGPIAADGYHWYQLEMADGDIAWAIGEGLI